MRCLVQRVAHASVAVGSDEVGRIGRGLCVFVGVTHSDDEATAETAADKLWNLRVFEDGAGVMNLSAREVGAEILVVSQFTLYGDASRGRRPSWTEAARPEQAEPIVDAFVAALQRLGAPVATGRFRAHMGVALVNDGPVTLLVEVNRRR